MAKSKKTIYDDQEEVKKEAVYGRKEAYHINATLELMKNKKSGTLDTIEVKDFIEYLTPAERICFVNEAHRLLKSGGELKVISMHWSTVRSIADLAVQWPPVSEAWFTHLNKQWRDQNNPYEKRYTCDFEVMVGYSLHPLVGVRNQEYQQFAVMHYKEAAQEVMATLSKR